MLQPGTVLQERFLIEQRIGHGGMGAVYLATDQKFGSRVAIKETFYDNRELADAFEREARLLNGLHHPVLPHVSDYFSEGDEHFLVMEYIEGEDLSEMLKQGHILSIDDVIRWTIELLDALDYLHSQDPPIIHRDIKPNNLKVTTRGNIVLLDFGLAKETTGNTLGMKSIFGYSRRYSPLEQIEGTGTDTRSDLFALGATVFHLLTGEPPVDVLARASAIVAGRPDPLQNAREMNENVPADFSDVIHSALALNADLRFSSARAMRNALEHALGMDGTDPVDRTALKPPVLVVSDKEVAAAESFAARDAFKDDTDPDVVGTTPQTKYERSFEPVELVKETTAKRHSSISGSVYRTVTFRPAVWLVAITLLATILGYGLYRSNSLSSSAQVTPNQEEEPIDEVKSEPVAESADIETPAEPLSPTEPEAPSDKKPVIVTDSPQRAEQVSKTEAPNELPQRPVKSDTPVKARVDQRTPTSTPVRSTVQPQRQTAQQNDRPSASDIETILTGNPSEPDRRDDWQRRREWEQEQHRLRQQRRARRLGLPF